LRRPSRRLSRLLLAGVVAAVVLIPSVGVASCKFAFDCPGGPSELPTPTVERPGLVDSVVASDFQAPSAFAFLPDGRILVAQVDGAVYVVKDGKRLVRPFLDLRGKVNTERMRGLVGLEAAPDFAATGHVFLMYAYEDHRTAPDAPKAVRVTRVTAEGDRARPASEVTIVGGASRGSCEGLSVAADCIPGNGIHTGGGLDFSPDGTLFIGTGDGEIGEEGDFEPRALRAQNLDSLAGKVLRVTRAGKGLATNPFWTGDAGANRSKVWAYGLRNPFRLAVRPGSATPYVGDVGWDTYEEIDVAARASNHGWPCYEGRSRALHYDRAPECRPLYRSGAADGPLVQYPHTVGKSVTGGDFHEAGEYLYGDYTGEWLRSLRLDRDGKLVAGSTKLFATGTAAPTQIRIGPDGDLYYLSITGTLHRIRAVKR
jgi:glucose/arabinose dehydrogenase